MGNSSGASSASEDVTRREYEGRVAGGPAVRQSTSTSSSPMRVIGAELVSEPQHRPRAETLRRAAGRASPSPGRAGRAGRSAAGRRPWVSSGSVSTTSASSRCMCSPSPLSASTSAPERPGRTGRLRHRLPASSSARASSSGAVLVPVDRGVVGRGARIPGADQSEPALRIGLGPGTRRHPDGDPWDRRSHGGDELGDPSGIERVERRSRPWGGCATPRPQRPPSAAAAGGDLRRRARARRADGHRSGNPEASGRL